MADTADESSVETPESPTETARTLLEGVRRSEPVENHKRRLASYDRTDLNALRTNRDQALAFWLNVYNAATQLLLDRRPALFESKWKFFRATAITVAGVKLSLDDIEHGILRNRKSKYGFGYLPRLRRSGLSEFRLQVDPRIHFALNCGAASCPAIRSYLPARVDEQLDLATEVYLEETVQYSPDQDRIVVPRLCLWYIGDFGGRSGIREMLIDYEIIPSDTQPSVRFASYDWSRQIGKFAN